MEENKNKIFELCKKAGISEGKLKNEYLYTVDVVDYYFYDGNIGEQDIKENFVDGPNDGGIDYIYTKDDQMYLIQGKSGENITIDDIKNIFYKIDDTVKDFEKEKCDQYSKKLQSTYLNAYDSLSDDKNIVIVLFTNTNINSELAEKIEKFKCSDRMRNYTIAIYGKTEIENKKVISNQENDFIKEDSIQLYVEDDHKRNVLRYGENGMIVNIRASSLRRIYKKHEGKGLFSYNLREHINQKNVDSGIEHTIKNEKDNFWFYNNGITIGCGDYLLDGNVLKLYDFSIINGAQTTTKVGESKLINDRNDFAIVCKVVKAKQNLSHESNFIMKISEASNSQKPIRPRDLRANAIEQKKLAVNAEKNNYPLAVEIKRGVRSKNYNKVDKWQRVTNEYLGQLILACILQQPGTARSGKASIFTSDKIYNKIYFRNHDYNVLYDLVRIANVYEEFKVRYTEDTENVNLIAICKNGKFIVLAIIFFLYKYFKGIIKDSDDQCLQEDNIKDTTLTLEYNSDDYEQRLNSLFKFIIKNLNSIYEKKKNDLKLTSYSNFFKTDKTYQEVILKEFDDILKDDWDKERLQSDMKIFLI